MNYNSEKIEAVLNGFPETLTTDDVSMIVVDLVRRIETLEDYVNGLSGELQALQYKPPSTTKARAARKSGERPRPIPTASQHNPRGLRVFTKEEQAKLKGGK